MSTQGIRRRNRRLGLAVLGLALGVSFEANAAIVYVCAGPSSQPDLVYNWVAAYYGGEFPLGEQACEKITKKAIEACHKAVSEAEKCQQRMYGSLRNIVKPGCDGDPDCTDEKKESIEQGSAFLEDDAAFGHEDCDGDFAETLFDYCITGVQ